MRILVISTCFHPKNSIASYRIEAFARMLRADTLVDRKSVV